MTVKMYGLILCKKKQKVHFLDTLHAAVQSAPKLGRTSELKGQNEK
jgi:hypothetical protein